jgi:hypothetical protein
MRVGLAFLSQPELDWPLRLMPGAAGNLVPWAEGLGLSLLYPQGWWWGAPLWIPGVSAAEHAACREAVNAAPERVSERFRALVRWPVTEALTERLTLWVAGREDDRIVLRANSAADRHPDDTAALLVAAAEKHAQAVIVFAATRIEIWGTAGGCSVGLFIDGRVRALRVPDGGSLSMPPLSLRVCRTPTAIPLERFLRDDDALRLAQEAAADCIVREVLEWIDKLPPI